MRIEDVAGLAFAHVFGRIFRRALLILLIAGFAIVALYYFTAAGVFHWKRTLVLCTHS